MLPRGAGVPARLRHSWHGCGTSWLTCCVGPRAQTQRDSCFRVYCFPAPTTLLPLPRGLLPAAQPCLGGAVTRPCVWEKLQGSPRQLGHCPCCCVPSCASGPPSSLHPLVLPPKQGGHRLLPGQPRQPLTPPPCLRFWSLLTHPLSLHFAARMISVSHVS